MKDSPLVPANLAARKLRVPKAWLESEAGAGRLPHLRAGDHFLFDIDLLSKLLLDRAREGGKGVSNVTK